MATPNYIDRNALMTNAEFRGRVRYGMINETNGVLAEDPATDKHAQRVALANGVLAAPDSYVERAMPILLTDGNVAGSAPDGASLSDETLQGTIGAAWNKIAELAFPVAA